LLVVRCDLLCIMFLSSTGMQYAQVYIRFTSKRNAAVVLLIHVAICKFVPVRNQTTLLVDEIASAEIGANDLYSCQNYLQLLGYNSLTDFSC
jgi:hypothetical protein